MRIRTRLVLLFLACLGGCAAPIVFRHVRLDPPKGDTPQVATTWTTTNADVQEALRLVDSVVRRQGLVRGPDATPTEKTPLERMYGTPATSAKPTHQMLHCYVRLQDGRLDVVLCDFGRRRPSPESQQIREEVARQFAARFGKERVK